jgi:ABC-2 type transport system permease protein
VHIPLSTVPALALAILVTSVSCTGFGLFGGAIGLRMRDAIVLINLMDAALLVFCGVNVPLDGLPDWMPAVAQGLPVTRGLQAARNIAGGETLAENAHLILGELAVGAVYTSVGFGLLRYFEAEARRHATLERS